MSRPLACKWAFNNLTCALVTSKGEFPSLASRQLHQMQSIWFWNPENSAERMGPRCGSQWQSHRRIHFLGGRRQQRHRRQLCTEYLQFEGKIGRRPYFRWPTPPGTSNECIIRSHTHAANKIRFKEVEKINDRGTCNASDATASLSAKTIRSWWDSAYTSEPLQVHNRSIAVETLYQKSFSTDSIRTLVLL